eukprot:TRINITY_DN1046_c0_g1_i3.p1 TRINITY_DN1046_c0_g1~~TRINITY_DN1046_c0_g1_i3.p1  ORF type:complete len:247 (+),score=34.43 TRINITY_DN1046_c0_g1_i3:679-1419(+)
MTYPIYVLCRLLLGTLYPGFQSFKAVKTKNIREYVKWMMYWIVFALYTGIESFMDIFVAFWFPFYYEIKIVILMWLLSPVAEGSLGSSITYRKFVHPFLLKEEDEIDKYLTMIGNQGYKTFWKYSNEGFNFITRMVMQTAIKNFPEITNQGATTRAHPRVFEVEENEFLMPQDPDDVSMTDLMTESFNMSDEDVAQSSFSSSPQTKRRRSKRINKRNTANTNKKQPSSAPSRSQSRQRKKKETTKK